MNNTEPIYEINIIMDILKKKRRVVFLVTFTFILLAVIYSFAVPRVYNAQAVFQIDKFIQIKEMVLISNLYSSTITTGNLKRVSFADLGTGDKFSVSFDFSEPFNMDEFVNKYTNYIKESALFTKALKSERERIEQRLNYINPTLEIYEKTKNVFMNKSSKNIFILNPIDMERGIFELQLEKKALTKALENLKVIEPIIGPTKNPNPLKPKPVLYVFAAAFAGLIIGVVLALFLNYFDSSKGRKEAS